MHIDISDKFASYSGFQYGGDFYKYKNLPWGTSIAPFVLQSFTESISDMLRDKFQVNTRVYLDDFLITHSEKEKVQEALDYLKEFLKEAGFVVNLKKSSVEPTQKIDWLGFTLTHEALELQQEKYPKRHEAYLKLM